MKTSVITGVTGQDGAYLAQQLLDRGEKVFGAFRRASSVNFWRLEELGILDHADFNLVEFDLTDPGACLRLLEKAKPDCVYNLAAQSFVGVSFEQPIATAHMTGIGALHLLEAIRHVNREDQILSGLDLRTIWAGPGRSTERGYAVLSSQPLCRCQTVRSLDDG